MSSAGSWLKGEGRFKKIVESLSKLSKRIERDAPY